MKRNDLIDIIEHAGFEVLPFSREGIIGKCLSFEIPAKCLAPAIISLEQNRLALGIKAELPTVLFDQNGFQVVLYFPFIKIEG